MARSYSALTMGSVAVQYTRERKLKGSVGGVIRTGYSQTLEQAVACGVVILNADGKICEITMSGVTITLPERLQPEDVYDLNFLVPLTEEGIKGIDEKLG